MTGEDDVAASRVARILAAAPGVACTILQRPGTRPVFTYASARLIDVYGCAPQELERDEDLLNGLLGLPGELAGIDRMARAAAAGTHWRQRFAVRHRTRAQLIWLECHLQPDPQVDGTVIWDGFLTDITEMKAQETQAESLNRLLRTLSEANQAIVRATSERELLHRICRIAADTGGFLLASIGLVTPDLTVRAVACAGPAQAYMDDLVMSADPSVPEGRGPGGEALRTGRLILTPDFQSNPRTAPWHDRAKAFGIVASIGLPLLVDGKVLGVFSVYSSSPDSFSGREVSLLEDIAADIAYGLDAFHRIDRLAKTSSELAYSLQQLRSIEESARVGSFRITLPDWQTWWSEGAAMVLGAARQEGDGGPVALNISMPMLHSLLAPATAAALESGDNLDVDLPVDAPGAARRWVRVFAVPIRRTSDGVEIDGTVQDITEQKRLEVEVASVAEAERRRLGAEIHDDLGQILTAASLTVAASSKLAREQGTHDSLAKVAGLLQHAIGVARTLAHGMLPPLAGDLPASLALLAQNTSACGVACRLVASENVGAKLAIEQVVELVRIAQESVTNALKHANCTTIVISVTERDGLLELSINDDGVGIPTGSSANSAGAGMRTMRYRAARVGGAFMTRQAPEGGTTVRVLIPIALVTRRAS